MDGLILLLALIGAWHLLGAVWRLVLSFRYAPPRVGLLFLVKDNEDKVEGLFRQLALDCYSFGSCQGPGRVVVADMGSRDQTPDILRRLAQQYSFLHLRFGINAENITDMTGTVLVLDMRELSVNQARQTIRKLLTPGQIETKGEPVGERG